MADREEQFIAEKTTKIATRLVAISSILAKPEMDTEDRKQLEHHLVILRNIAMGKEVGLSQEITTIAKAVALKAKVEVEKSLPEAEILAFGSGGAHATFPVSLKGKKIKYYVQGSGVELGGAQSL